MLISSFVSIVYFLILDVFLFCVFFFIFFNILFFNFFILNFFFRIVLYFNIYMI